MIKVVWHLAKPPVNDYRLKPALGLSAKRLTKMCVNRCNRSALLSCLLLFLCLKIAVCQTAVCNNCCNDHQNISEPRRSTKSVWRSGQIVLCDMNVRYGWYRFTSFVGAKMPESVVQEGHCGTHDPIWLNGTHPTEEEGNAARTVCINSFGLDNGCYDHFDINVRNCGGYFVYYLKPLYYCAAAYCAGKKAFCTSFGTRINFTRSY